MTQLVIGLTGGIGSGKTFCSQIFQSQHIPVYNSDVEAKQLMRTELRQPIIELFGEDAFQENQLNRSWIAQQVFQDKTLLNQLNSIVHPAVKIHRNEWINQQSSPICIIEAAILIESKGHLEMDNVITVYAPLATRVERVINRDQSKAEEVHARIQNQLSDIERFKYSDFVIHNYAHHSIEQQIQLILHQLTRS